LGQGVLKGGGGVKRNSEEKLISNHASSLTSYSIALIEETNIKKSFKVKKVPAPKSGGAYTLNFWS
jgi:hypothetical protein